ncbi:tRNA (adenosine(37)-N6)-threonylcarbamoyltransferase complex ATPase subunit type 1 TsaE [Candidatus Liberibacter africanus]|nr:tRNA (adenosine(37)-N6)-threonylcarbamoyltransferase complex ATPase subunit type 1 TsaE [Candidatus Liberibacter africanus]
MTMNFSEKNLTIIPLLHEKNTVCLGNHLASILKLGDCLTLSGDLGAGKTFLARSIIRFLTKNPELEVLSPTFTLVQLYDASIPIAHFDFYRLSGHQEVFELGLDEILNERICIIEWPEIGRKILPQKTIDIQLSQDKNGRKATVSAEKWIISHLNKIKSPTY